jgi:flagellar motor switch protein FliM
MAEILSRSEMDSLLMASDRRTGIRSAGPSTPVHPELIRSIRAVHEGFAGELAASLTGLLRLPVDVRLISVDQLTYGEFTVGLEAPACLNLIQVAPLEGSWLLELNRSIAFPVVDRLLGGGGALSQNAPMRPLTDIEWRMLARMTDRVAAALRSAWSDVCDLTPKVTGVGSHPHALPFVAPEAMVVLVSFDVSIGDAAGMLNLCLPSRMLASLADRLTAGPHNGPQSADRAKAAAGSIGARQAGVELIVELASTRLTTEEVTNLAVGDVIVTNCDHGQPLSVRVDGDSRFAGFAGLVKGRKAVRIDAARLPLSSPQRPSSLIVEEQPHPTGENREFVEGD